MFQGGYMGKLLRIDLNTGNYSAYFRREPINCNRMIGWNEQSRTLN